MSTRNLTRSPLSAGDTVGAQVWIDEAQRVKGAVERREALGNFAPGNTEYYAYATGALIACVSAMTELLEKALASAGGAR